MRPFAGLLVITAAIAMTPGFALAAKKRFSESGGTLPAKLPAKAPKRTYIDFSKSDANAVVESPKSPSLGRALKKSDQDVQAAAEPKARAAATPTEVRSRKILAAPSGDSAESLSAFVSNEQSRAKIEIAKPAPMATPLAAPVAIAAPAMTPSPKPATPQATPVVRMTPSAPRTEPAPVAAETPAPKSTEKLVTEPEIVAVEIEMQPKVIAAPVAAPTLAEKSELPSESVAASGGENGETASLHARLEKQSLESGSPRTMAFIRTGYLNANYKKFDDRMKNSATSIGMGAARNLETSWGTLEARAAFDVFHAADQSVTVDNVRMFTARTEVAYWLSNSRVKPGLSFGLGWADYSIRSYRAVEGDERTVTIRTHAKGNALTFIPAVSLRVELAKELVVDVQTEFLGLLGGESSDAAQGLAATAALGWLF